MSAEIQVDLGMVLIKLYILIEVDLGLPGESVDQNEPNND